MCNCSTIVTPKKALFDAISLLGDLVIAYRINCVVIVPKAFRTFHDQCRVLTRIFAMFTWTFRVRGGGRFGATTFCFLIVVFSVVLDFLGAFSFLLLFLFSISDELSSLLLSLSDAFLHFGSLFPFLLDHLKTFCS